MSRIGRYEIEAEIGRGAMGVVYLARDPRLRRQVAVKVYNLPAGLPAEEHREFRARFLHEAQAAAALSHPAIVAVHDADQDPERNVPYIAMEYVPGRTLADRLAERGRLEPDAAFAMAEVLAEALHEAHRAGIVHRDLKPANILLREPDGAPKIADFGVARLATSRLTRTGAAVGSPGYMSPEQIQGRAVDGRSDLFSLATLLYECLTGERPFAGEDMASLAYAIVHEGPVPITRKAPELPAGLDAFFDRALAKDPAARFQDGTAFCRALREARAPGAGRAATATVVAGAPGRRGLLAAAALLAAAFGLWWSWGEDPKGAWLQLDARSSVPRGTLTLRVDGRKVYSRKLETGDTKTVGLLKRVVGKGQESFEALIDVAPGRHEVLARVVTEDRPSGFEDMVVVELAPGETRRLSLAAGRTFGTPLALRADQRSTP